MKGLGHALIFLGLTFLILGLKSSFIGHNLASDGVEGLAKVSTSFHNKEGDDTSYYLRLELPDSQKTKVTAGVNYQEFCKHGKGDEVPVVYLPDEPTVYMLGGNDTARERRSGSGWMALSGPIFLILGLFLSAPRQLVRSREPSKDNNVRLESNERKPINWFGYFLIALGVGITFLGGKEFWYRHHYNTPVTVIPENLTNDDVPLHGLFPELFLDTKSAYAVFRKGTWEVEYLVLPYKNRPEDDSYVLVLQLSDGPIYHGLQNACNTYHRNSAIASFWARYRTPHSVEFWLDDSFESELKEGLSPSTLYGIYDGPTSNLWPSFWVLIGLFLMACGPFQRADRAQLREQLGEATQVIEPFVS